MGIAERKVAGGHIVAMRDAVVAKEEGAEPHNSMNKKTDLKLIKL